MGEQDVALVVRARGGDRAAFEELVRRTSRLVYARLYLDTGDTHLAEDLLQETMLRAFRSLRKLDRADGFRAWLLKIAQNVLTDSIRNKSRQKRTEPLRSDQAVDSISTDGPVPEADVEHQEMRQQVLAVLRSLPEEYRLPLTLRYIGGADYETISEQLGLTNGSLRGLLHRGLKMLRDRLPPEFGKD
jgi:RNA polymerase sigma-70 factor (ECF subfamily)